MLVKQNDNKKLGIVYIIISAFCFSVMSLFIRLSGDLPTMQKCFFRNIVALIIASSALIRSGKRLEVGKGNVKYLFARAIGGSVGMVTNFYAIDHLAISDASILNKLSPFFAIIFSSFILKEFATKQEWIAVIIAFFGALFVVKPSFNLEVIPALAGVIGGCGAGFAYTYVRKMGKLGINGMIIVAFFSGFTTLITLPFVIFDYHSVTLFQLFCLIMTGVAAAFGQVFITKAYSKAPAGEISVYDFTNVIFSAMLGFMFLDQIPDYLSIIGYVIIIGTYIAKWKIASNKQKNEHKIQEKPSKLEE